MQPNDTSVDIWIAQPDAAQAFCAELSEAVPDADIVEIGDSIYQQRSDSNAFANNLPIAFVRQRLPNAITVSASSINQWAETVNCHLDSALGTANSEGWQLHTFPAYGAERNAGIRRASLIEESLLKLFKRSNRLRYRALAGAHSIEFPALAQLCLLSPESGYFSFCTSAERIAIRRSMSPFCGGLIELPEDKEAPSRAFGKLLEAQLLLGKFIKKDDRCVDLGAAPGSWTYLAALAGAGVQAIDRAALREDLMRNPKVQFHSGDAFGFVPAKPVDWLLCDVIAAPERSIALLGNWIKQGWCRSFCVTIKFKGVAENSRLSELKSLLADTCGEFYVRRLNSNKNEVTAVGSI